MLRTEDAILDLPLQHQQEFHAIAARFDASRIPRLIWPFSGARLFPVVSVGDVQKQGTKAPSHI